MRRRIVDPNDRVWKYARLFALPLLTLMLGSLVPGDAAAIPAWTRKHGLPCSACHYPAPPRLNTFGHQFRRAQFRTPEELNQEVDFKRLADFVSMRIRSRYNYDSPEDGFPTGSGTSPVSSGFALNDATLFFAGPVAKHFSGFVELERPGNEEIIEAVVSAGGIYGNETNFWTFRIGQFHTLARVGFGGLDRPTGISTPLALSSAVVSGNAFKLNQDQVGAEGTWVRKNGRVIFQVLNGADLGGAGTTDRGDQNRDKDFLLAYELLWGDIASGLTVFAYDGRQDDLTSAAAPDVISVKRYGITAAQVFKSGFEVQGGLVAGTDDYSLPVGGVDSIDGRAFWLELEQNFSNAKDLTVFARWDSLDSNTDIDDNERDQITLGFVWPVSNWHVRWGFEYQNVTQENALPIGDLRDQKAVAEIMLNF